MDGSEICTWENIRETSKSILLHDILPFAILPFALDDALTSSLAPPGGTNRATADLLLSLVPAFPITNYFIDDGWQDIAFDGKGIDTTYCTRISRLHSFQPWPGFGATMSSVVAHLKSKDIANVGIWLTIQGYWFGIDPKSAFSKKHDCQSFKTTRGHRPRGGISDPPAKGDGQEIWIPSALKARAFWRDWCAELKSWVSIMSRSVRLCNGCRRSPLSLGSPCGEKWPVTEVFSYVRQPSGPG